MKVGNWTLVSDDGVGTRVWEAPYDDHMTIVKTEYYATEEFFGANSEEYKDSEGQKFGDFRKVASIPMHIWARKLAEAQRNGDQKYIKKFLNDYDNRCYRTFKGKI